MTTVTRRPYPRSVLSMVDELDGKKPARAEGKKKPEPVEAVKPAKKTAKKGGRK